MFFSALLDILFVVLIYYLYIYNSIYIYIFICIIYHSIHILLYLNLYLDISCIQVWCVAKRFHDAQLMPVGSIDAEPYVPGHRPLRPKKKVLIEAPNVAVNMGAIWSYNPYKRPHKWVTGVISPYFMGVMSLMLNLSLLGGWVSGNPPKRTLATEVFIFQGQSFSSWMHCKKTASCRN